MKAQKWALKSQHVVTKQAQKAQPQWVRCNKHCVVPSPENKASSSTPRPKSLLPHQKCRKRQAKGFNYLPAKANQLAQTHQKKLSNVLPAPLHSPAWLMRPMRFCAEQKTFFPRQTTKACCPCLISNCAKLKAAQKAVPKQAHRSPPHCKRSLLGRLRSANVCQM